MSSDPVDELINASNAFLIPLRMGEGFDKLAFDSLIQAICSVHKAFLGEPNLPKLAVSVFIELPMAVDACKTFYSGAEQEAVNNATAQLFDAIMDGLTNSDT